MRLMIATTAAEVFQNSSDHYGFTADNVSDLTGRCPGANDQTCKSLD